MFPPFAIFQKAKSFNTFENYKIKGNIAWYIGNFPNVEAILLMSRMNTQISNFIEGKKYVTKNGGSKSN